MERPCELNRHCAGFNRRSALDRGRCWRCTAEKARPSTQHPTAQLRDRLLALEVEDGTASTGRLVWGAESKITIFDAMWRGSDSSDVGTEAAEWLADYLALMNGRAGSAQIKAAGRTLGSHATA